jgi:hypothetical protein
MSVPFSAEGNSGMDNGDLADPTPFGIELALCATKLGKGPQFVRTGYSRMLVAHCGFYSAHRLPAQPRMTNPDGR